MMKQSRTAALTTAEVLSLPAMVPLDDSNRAIHCGRTLGYALAKAGDYPVPVHRLGNQYRVARADLLRFLGIEEPLTQERSAA